MPSIDDLPSPKSASRGGSIDDLPAPSGSRGPSKFESVSRGVKQGATFNSSDEIGGRVQQWADSVAGLFGDSVTETNAKLRAEGFEGDIGPTTSRGLYERARDTERAADAEAREANPKSFLAGEVAGAIGTAFAPGVGIAKGAKLGTTVAKSALQGGATAAGATESDLTSLEGLKDVRNGTALGGGLPIALKFAPTVIRGVAKMGKKSFAATTGMSEELIDHYLKFSNRVNTSEPLEVVKDKLDELYSTKKAAAELSESVLDTAKSKASEAEGAFKTARDAKSFDLKNQRFDAGRAYDDAKRSAELLPSELDESISSAVRDLRRNLSEKSAEAWEKLPYGGSEKGISRLKGEITAKINSLKVGGEAVGDQASGAINSLQRLRTQLDSLKSVSPREAKQIIQNLQRDVDAAGGYGGAAIDAAVIEKRAIAADLNKHLKTTYPEYAEAMKPTARAAALLSDLDGVLDRESARKLVSSAFGKNGDIAISKLGELENILGTPGRFTSKIQSASNRLKDTDGVLNRMADPEWAASEMARINPSKVKATSEMVDVARSSLDDAKAAVKSVGRISPDRSQSLIERSNPFRTRVNIEDQKFLDQISAQSGTDFKGMIKDSAAKQAFEKGNVHGSRNTLLWGALGFVTGGLPGAGAGAAFGHTVMDRYGPKGGKLIMDGLLKAQKAGRPVSEAIESLGVPAAVREDIKRQIAPIIGRIKTAEEGQMSRVAGDSKGEDRWAMRGAEKLGVSPELAERAMKTKEGKRLLIEASDLSAGSKRLETILKQLSKGWEYEHGNEPGTVSEAEILQRKRNPASGR